MAGVYSRVASNASKDKDKTPVVPVPQVEVAERTAATDKDIKVYSNIAPKISDKVSSKISSPVTSDRYDYFDAIRRAVRSIGNVPMPLRTTSTESDRMKAVVRQYEDQGIYTDRTQLLRVLLNYGLDELEREGENSIIHKALMRIHVD